ncbi:uncharacterized protein METZ01_LOCUS157524 [marine metagenome]|uniref:Uncharacterized protein n=1 Tax=marine metagenome TaxID=408172 RepID=A0A382AT01_9ZZZZ
MLYRFALRLGQVYSGTTIWDTGHSAPVGIFELYLNRHSRVLKGIRMGPNKLSYTLAIDRYP